MKNLSGSLSVVISALLFGTIGIFNRWIPLNAFVQSCWRFAFATTFFALFFKDARRLPNKRDFLPFLILGASLGSAGALFALSVNYIPVGTAGFCYQSLPVFVLIMSGRLFKERVSLPTFASIALALVGTALLAPPSAWKLSGNELVGVLIALASALAGASMMVCLQWLSGTYTSLQRTLWMSLGAGILLTPSLFVVREQPYSPFVFGMLAVLGLIAGLGSYFANLGISQVGATRTSILLYVEPVAAAGYATAIFHERLTLLNWGGALLIVCAGLIILPETTKPPKGEDHHGGESR